MMYEVILYGKLKCPANILSICGREQCDYFIKGVMQILKKKLSSSSDLMAWGINHRQMGEENTLGRN